MLMHTNTYMHINTYVYTQSQAHMHISALAMKICDLALLGNEATHIKLSNPHMEN